MGHSRKLLGAVIAACVAITFVLAACGSSDSGGDSATSGSTGSTTTGKADKDLTIGFSNYALTIPFYQSMKAGIEDQAAKYGWKVVTTDSNFDAGKQASDVQGLLTQGVDAIIMSPGDANALVPTAKAIADAKIPLITASNQLADAAKPYVLTAYGRAWDQVGEMKTDELAKLMGDKGKMAIIRGPSGTSFVIGTTEGSKRALAQHPDIKAVFDRNAQSFEAGEGQRLAEAALTANPDITGIWVENDDLAAGVAKAVADRGLTGKVHIVSTDGSSVGVDLVRNGELDWTLGVPSYDAGKRMMEILHAYEADGTKPAATEDAKILEITKDSIPEVDKVCEQTPKEIYCKQ